MLGSRSSYTVNLPVYEGPLDLLLDLIERAELDVTAVSLAQVTDQYLAYVHALEQVTADELSAFLVIAARLIQIKSEALLPRPPVREPGEISPAEDLARQLRLYKRYKQIALWLEDRQDRNLRTFLRVAPPPKVEARPDLSEITLLDLVQAVERVFGKEASKPALATVIAPPKITIREKIALVTSVLRRHGRLVFQRLFSKNPTRLEVVVTFLAILELIKRHRVRAQQETLFGEIVVEVSEEFGEGEEFDLEFE